MRHKIEIAPNLAICIDGERVIGSKPQGLFLTTEMIVSDEDLKRLADRCLEVISDRKTESQTCEECEHWSDPDDGCADRHGCKTEPQPQSLLEGYFKMMNEMKAEQTEPHPTCKKCKHFKYRTNCGWECEYDTFEECNYEPKCSEIIEAYSQGFKDGSEAVQTDCTTCDQVGRCERGRAVECPLTERSE